MSALDVRQLLDARLWVARLGESDVLRWWRTDGILGPDGAFVGPRVLPKTHPTARSRIAFAVARHACDERHPDPSVMHLFRLDPETEDRFDALLVEQLDAFDYWSSIIGALEKVIADQTSAKVLKEEGVVGDEELRMVESLDLGPAGRSLPLPSASTEAKLISTLAAGFARSEPGKLVVPWVPGASTG